MKLSVWLITAVQCFSVLAILNARGADTVATTPQEINHALSPTTRVAASILSKDIRQRDPFIYADESSRTYYLIGAAYNYVRMYSSKDLLHWSNPRVIFTLPKDLWGDVPITGVWAPEMHVYKGKYYLFVTFDTSHQFAEQWRGWLPRVTRGTQILVADALAGPYRPFNKRSTLPTDMMTIDGTFWVEAGIPYMIFSHEWVQITNGSMSCMRLTDDLSDTIGEPKVLFHGSEAPWSVTDKRTGDNVTDGPYLYQGKSGKLFMIWSSFGVRGYTTGISISSSGKLAGPWTQQAEPLYPQPLSKDDGGHGMIFKSFDGKLMLILHAPNGPGSRPRIFQLQDTGDTLRISSEFDSSDPRTARP